MNKRILLPVLVFALSIAGKLFALNPSLTPEEVIDLMIKGADKNDEGLRLIHPKRSVELLKEQM